MNVLKVENLCKKIGSKVILKNISFELKGGDILAFIGPNGAGKTTLIKCLLGLQKITSGTVKIANFDLKTNFKKAIKEVGSLVESPDVYMYLTGYENLKLVASMYKNVTKSDITRVIKLVSLEDHIHEKVSKYSLGMRQRLSLALALLNKPKLLILDEPTNGLDPISIKALRDLLLALAKEDTAILISSHNLSELESFCTQALIMKEGTIVAQKSLTSLKHQSKNQYLIKVKNTSKIPSLTMNYAVILDHHYFKISQNESDLWQLIQKLVKHNIAIYEIKKEEMTLEEAFMSLANNEVSTHG